MHAINSGLHIHQFNTRCLYRTRTHPKRTATKTLTHASMYRELPGTCSHACTHLAVNYRVHFASQSISEGKMGAGASSISLRPFLEQGIEKWREKTHTGEWIYETGLNKLSKAIQGFMCTHIHTQPSMRTWLTAATSVKTDIVIQKICHPNHKPTFFTLSLSHTRRLTSLHAYTHSLSLSSQSTLYLPPHLTSHTLGLHTTNSQISHI